jgi:predicted RND superfamily exporter protein
MIKKERKNPDLSFSPGIRQKIKEAELYLSQSLFDEAQAIYQNLISDYQTQLQKTAGPYGKRKKELRAEINVFRKRLKKIDRLRRAFYQPAETSKLNRFRVSFETVCRHPLVFLFASVLFASIFIAFNPFVKTVNNVDYFTLENDPDVAFYEEFKQEFGNDEFFVIAFEKGDLFSEKNLAILKTITEDLERLEEIKEITSLANVEDIIGGSDYFEVKNFLEVIPESEEERSALKIRAIGNPLYVNNFISHDGNTAAILVQTYDLPDDEDYRKRLIEKTKEILNHHREEVDRFYLGGWTTTNLSLSQYVKTDTAVFVPATYLIITLAIWLFFRNISLTLVAFVNISVCVACTRGFMGLMDITINNVTTIIIPLVMALSLCDTVHIFSQMDKRILEKIPDKAKALAHVLHKVFLPCFLTTLTTAVGFLSLSVSQIPPIKEFAWIASVGMVFEFIFSFFLLPPLLMFCKPEKIYREHTSQAAMTYFLHRLNALVQRHSRKIAVFSFVILLIAGWCAGKLKVETNLVEFFKKSSPVRTSLDFVENRLSGVGTIDISLKAEELDAFKAPENLKLIDRIQKHVDSIESVDKTVSFVDFLKDMNQSFHDENPLYYKIPETMEMVSQYLLLYDSDDIEDFINGDFDHARISARISEHSSSGQERIIRQVKGYLSGIAHPGVVIRVTGRAVNDVNTIDALVKGQVYSLSIAAVVISTIMFLVFRSVSIAALSMLPNAIPIVLNFGIMGAAGIPLDTGTALIAAVALGIAVDDTIHFLSEYRNKRRQKKSASDSLEIVTLNKGEAILSSSLILCMGFGVLVLSRFVPIIHFGLLSAVIMLTALLGDIVVLPSFILLKKE